MLKIKAKSSLDGTHRDRFGVSSCALSVDDGSAMLLVVLLGDPGRGEGAERGEGRSSLPHGVLTVSGSDDTDLSAGGGERDELGLQAIGNTIVHGGTTGHDDVLAQVFTDIDIGGLDGSPGEAVDGLASLAILGGVEEELRASHAHGGGDGDDSLIGESVLDIVL